MKRIFQLLTLAASAPLAACSADDTHFSAGTWELQSWMEVEGRGDRTAPQSETVIVTDEMAALDAKVLVFSKFYHGQQATNVVFENGVISGNLDQQAVAPFPDHRQQISGRYSRDAFEMRIALPAIAGHQTYQVVTGELVKPL